MDRATYDALYDDDVISSVGVFAAAGTDTDTLIATLREIEAGDALVLIRSNRGLRAASLAVFDRTFAITAVLRVLALVVAFVGVLSALMALQLERTRELGVLRATGLTPRQLWVLIAAQTGLMGLAAATLAIPLGVGLAWTMVHVVNRRSFGWTIDLAVDPWILLQAVALAIGAALLAGAYPAWRMARTPPAAALREE
jgi:putative ABC transport system permease protein